jgi:hypothetical protein
MPSDVLITPATSKIDFTDASNSTKKLSISGTTFSFNSNLNVLSSTSLSSAFKAEGVNGTLFEVTDDLSNSLMSVNTIGGLPVFEVFANNSIIGGQYGANDFVISGNKIGLGYANPVNKLSISGSVSIGASYNVAAPSNGLIVQGNVGIATNNPGYTLEVNGTQRVVGNFYLFNTVVDPATNFSNQRGVGFEASTGKLEVAASASTALAIGRFGSTGQILDFRYEGTQIGNFSLDSTDLTLATSRHLILNPTGNVGIGIAIPTAPLEVQSNTGGTGIIIRGRADNSTALRFYANNGTTQQLYIGTDDSNIDFVSVSTRPIRFFVNALLQYQISQLGVFSWKDGAGGDRMRLNSTGLGIGTTSPNTLLNVHGDNPFVRINNTITGDHGIKISYNNSDTHGLHLLYNANNALSFIDNTYPTSSGQVYGDIYFRQNVAGTMTTRMTIKADGGGNVGIGTTNPVGKLDVRAGSGGEIIFGSFDANYVVKIQSGDQLNFYNGASAGAGYINYGGGATVLSQNLHVEKATGGATGLVRINSNGSVGIGTTVPSGLLDVYNGAGRYLNYGTTGLLKVQRNVATSDGATPVLHLINTQGMESSTGLGTGIQMDLGYGGFTTNTVGTAARGTRISAVNDTLYTSTASTQNASLVFYTSTAGSLTEKLRIRSDGSLSPVSISSTTAGATLLRTDGTNGTLFSVVDDLSDSLMSVNNSAGLPVLEVFADDRIVAGQYGQNDFVVVNNKVGIGTNSPAYKLDVRGSTENARVGVMEFGSWPLAATYIYLQNNTLSLIGGNYALLQGPTGETFVNAASGQVLHFRTNNTERWAILAAGILQSDGAQTIQTSTGPLTLATLAGDGHIVLSPHGNGNVGIGISSPTSKLSIAGSSATNFKSLILRNGDGTVGSTVSIDLETSAGTIGNEASMAARISGIRLGSGTTGGLIFSTTNSGTLGERVRIINDGNVGIGTTSPAYKLEVASGTSGQQSLVNFRTADSTTANNAGIQIFATPSATATSRLVQMVWDADGANASSGDYFLIKKRGDSGTTDFEQYSNASMRFGTNFISRATYDMTIANDGNVGIGTTVPSASLHVRGASFRFEDSSTSTNIRIGPMDNTYPFRRFDSYISDNTGYFWGFGQKTAAGATRVNAFFLDNNRGLFSADALRVVTFTANEYNGSIPTYSTPVLLAASGVSYINGGDVGIGTTVPAFKLDVNGNSAFRDTVFFGPSVGLISWGSMGGGTGFGIRGESGRGFSLGANGSWDYLVINTSGNVGIGTTSPTSLLHLAGVGGDGVAFLRIAGTASDAFNWGSSVMYANLAATETAINLIGKAQSQYNSCYIGYRHVADGSASNMLSLGLYAADHLVNILGNGNVGIGNITPANKLAVSGSVSVGSNYNVAAPANGLIVEGSVGIGVSSLSAGVKLHVDGFFISKTLWSDVAAHSYWGNYSTAYGRLTWDTGLAWINATAGNVLYLGADGGNKHVTIATSGNVGIGTVTPTSKLHLNSTTSGAILLKADGTNGTLFSVSDDLSNSLMSVNTIGGLPVFEVFANNSIIAGQYGQNDFVISGNKVGIGKSNPAYKLDVNGTGNFSGTLIVNGISINQERANNARMYGADTGAFGLLGLDSAGSFRWQVYGESGNYGFLDSTWGNWDIKKAVNGQLDLRVSGVTVRVLNAGNYQDYALPLAGGTLTGALSGTTATFSGAIVQGSSQVLHAGNVATYALPIGGGTLTGALSGTSATFSGTISEGGYLAYPLREYVINLSSQSTASFYPVAIDNSPGTDSTWHHQFSVDMVGQSGDAAYNMHSMYGEVRGQGWTDQAQFYRVFHNFYDNAERSILGIWRGTQTFYGVVVYLRGGKNYYVRTTSRSVVGYSAAQALGNAVFAIKNAAGADVSGTSANIGEMFNLINNPSGFYHSDNVYANLIGNVTGNVSGSSGTCTGLAASATTAAACTGNAVNVTGTVLVANGGTGVTTATANTFFAAPNGSTGAPSFRAMVSADIPANAVTFAKFQQMPTVSVLGVSGAATADVAAITGGGDQVLRMNAGATFLGFGAINLASSGAVTGILSVANGGTGSSTSGGGGSGTVTSVSVVSANGFDGSVNNNTTTPAITLTTTITGILKGNSTAISAATAGTDYLAPNTNITVDKITAAKAIIQKKEEQTNISGAVTIDVSTANVHVLTLNNGANVSSITYNNRAADPAVNTILLVIKYSGTSATIVWSNVIWANGNDPTLTKVNGYADVYALTSYKGAAGYWIGTVVAQNLLSTNL